MARPIRSFAARQADSEKQDTLETITCTERLLVEILLQLMVMQANRDQNEIARRLKRVGFSIRQVAALMDTTPASLAVARRRKVIAVERIALSDDQSQAIPEALHQGKKDLNR